MHACAQHLRLLCPWPDECCSVMPVLFSFFVRACCVLPVHHHTRMHTCMHAQWYGGMIVWQGAQKGIRVCSLLAPSLLYGEYAVRQACMACKAAVCLHVNMAGMPKGQNAHTHGPKRCTPVRAVPVLLPYLAIHAPYRIISYQCDVMI